MMFNKLEFKLRSQNSMVKVVFFKENATLTMSSKYYFFEKIALLLFSFFFLFSPPISSQLAIHLITNSNSPQFGCLQVNNVPSPASWDKEHFSQKDWKAVFPVQFGELIRDDLPAMLGTYWKENTTVFFKPRFPFTQGKTYTAAFKTDLWAEKTAVTTSEKAIIHSFQIPILESIIPSFVENIYPSDSLLPMNLLKIYLYFSAPMREGQAFEHLHLMNEREEEVKDPFLYMDKELWDKDQKRLTVWFDPGRIKRDLMPNELLGLPLQSGQSYRLVVDKNWQDLKGMLLKENFVKTFRVIDNDRIKPQTDSWKITYPMCNTREALHIDFGEAMDFALLQNSLLVLNDKDELVAGKIAIQNMENIWSFIPDIDWKSGVYKIRIATVLEDLAGNNLNRLFDRDIRKDAAAILNREFVELEFKI